MRRRVLALGAVLGVSGFGVGVAACVGDTNSQPPDAGADASDATSLADSGSDATEVFESGATCNNVDPATAPVAAVLACDLGSAPAIPDAGPTTIPLGRYYLSAQTTYIEPSCNGIDVTTPLHDVVMITQGDGGNDYTLNVGFSQGGSKRFTLDWQVSGTTLTQTAECPPSSNQFTGPFNVSVPATGGHLIVWQLVDTVYSLQSF